MCQCLKCFCHWGGLEAKDVLTHWWFVWLLCHDFVHGACGLLVSWCPRTLRNQCPAVFRFSLGFQHLKLSIETAWGHRAMDVWTLVIAWGPCYVHVTYCLSASWYHEILGGQKTVVRILDIMKLDHMLWGVIDDALKAIVFCMDSWKINFSWLMPTLHGLVHFVIHFEAVNSLSFSIFN